MSIGINLSPNAICNYACVYCQVDRAIVPRVSEVDLDRMRDELLQTISLALSGDLFADPSFKMVPVDKRLIKDIAFSGDGEPTAAEQFSDAVEIAALARRNAGLVDTKIVLITNACYLILPEVERALAVMDDNNGEVWAKLDAGTEAYHKRVNRPNFPLRHVIDNITAAARIRPVVIQSLFMRLDGCQPDGAELQAYVERLEEIVRAGGSIKYVQIYTVARRPSEECVAPLTKEEVDRIVELVHERTGLLTKAFYGPG